MKNFQCMRNEKETKIEDVGVRKDACENVSYVDTMTKSLNSEGHSCSDISQLLTHGFDELCMTSYDTNEFSALESCVACGGGKVVQDSWYETEAIQGVTECDDSMWDDRTDRDGDICDSYADFPDWCGYTTTKISHQTKCAARVEVVIPTAQ